MSAVNMNSIRKGYLLYRNILKSHSKNLPTQMRVLGDIYVQEEFRQNMNKADGDQFDQFLNSWEGYLKTIDVIPKKDMNTVKRILNETDQSELEDKLNEEQKDNLGEMKKFIYDSNRK
mmetsp:Transcript_17210/g.15215  ORF Transcript_17210/g.15215 Transcript_17210/m.15215 type:complete len:118 (+) Transcript_17210:17-370(+)